MFTHSARILARNVLVCLSLLVLLAACGDNEPEQRKAFIDILQKNVLDQKGGRVLLLTEDNRKALGPYAAQFDFFTDAVQASEKLDVNDQVNKIQKLTNDLNRTDDAEKRREILDSIDAIKDEVRASVQKLVGDLNAQKAALKQPDDVKAVFDKAYDKHIGKSVEISMRIFDASDAFMKSVRDLNAYVIAHPGKVQYKGVNVMILDDSVEKEVNGLLDAQTKEFNAMQKILQEAFKLQQDM